VSRDTRWDIYLSPMLESKSQAEVDSVVAHEIDEGSTGNPPKDLCTLWPCWVLARCVLFLRIKPTFNLRGPDCQQSRKTAFLLRKWRARRDSNSRPSGSKPDALIQLSYGRAAKHFAVNSLRQVLLRFQSRVSAHSGHFEKSLGALSISCDSA
jgi:hypothetical protein